MSSDSTAAGFFEQVSAVREQVMATLQGLGSQPLDGAAGVDTRVALQEAANQLGVAEGLLRRMAGSPNTEPADIVEPGAECDHQHVTFSGEAMAVFALAEMTVPYAETSTDAADRWLRALRRDGVVGRALGELGFGDEELSARAELPPEAERRRSVEGVRKKAITLTRRRKADSVTTTDILFAVIAIHDRLVDRALYARGITRGALLDQVAGGARVMARLQRSGAA